MQITERIHAIKIQFKVPVSPKISIDRFAFAYLVFGDGIHMIDCGVKGSESLIYQYLNDHGRKPEEISSLILTHSHPDHIGAAVSIKNRTGCLIIAHKFEQGWIENTEQQFKDRPVPGFHDLVEGPVHVDSLVQGDEMLKLEDQLICKIIHTPGHSTGSISLWFEEEKSLFTADALIFPGDLPIYEDISACFASIKTLQAIKNVENLFSSWEPPIQGPEKIARRMEESTAYLERIHNAVINISNGKKQENMMELCRNVVDELGLPPFAAMPLVAKAFASSIVADRNN